MIQQPKANAVMSADNRWRNARTFALSITPVSRMEGKPTLYFQRRRTIVHPPQWNVFRHTLWTLSVWSIALYCAYHWSTVVRFFYHQ